MWAEGFLAARPPLLAACSVCECESACVLYVHTRKREGGRESDSVRERRERESLCAQAC